MQPGEKQGSKELKPFAQNHLTCMAGDKKKRFR